MAKGDFKAADGYLKTLEKLIKGDSKAFHKWANKPIDRVKDKIKAWIQDPKIGLGIKDVSKEQVKFFSETSVKDKEGIPKKVYHGTRAPGFNNFEKGDIGFHFGTQEQANRVVKPRYEGEKNMAHLDKGGRVIEAYINIKNPIRLEEPYGGDWRNPDSIIGQLKKLGFKDLPKEKLNRAFGETSNAKTVKRYLEDIKDYLREKGYDGIVYRNQYEGMQPEAALLEGKDRDGWDWLRTEGSEKERVEFLRGIEAKPEYEGDQLGSDSYITFTAQQIKSVYNLKPESPEVAPRSLTGKSREVINEVEDIIASDSKFARFSAEQMQRKDIVKTFKDLKLKPKDRRGDRKVDYLRGIVQHLKDQVTSPKWGMSIEDVSGGKYDMDIKNRESKKREGKVRISAVDRKALGNDKEVANWKTYIINHPVSEGWAPMNPHRTPKGALVYKSESVDTFIHPPELYKKHILKGTKVPTTNAVKQRREQWKVEMMGKLRNETLGIVERANNGDAAAVTMLRQIEWYSNLKGKIRKQYGAYLDVFGDLLGAFSPQEKVHINFEYAQQALTEMHKGTYDAAMTEFVNYLEAGGTVSSYNGPKIMKLNNKLFGSNSKNGMLAVLGLWGKITVNSKSKTAPKARQFTRNIMGEPGVTIDVWAVRMLRRLAGARRIAPKAEKGVGGQHQSETDLQDISGAYGFAKDVFEGAAKDLRRSNIAMFSKLKGADLQAIQWFNEKHIWGKKGWTNEMGGSIEQQMELNPMSRLHTMLAVQQKDVPTNKVQARSQDLLLEATKNDPNVLVNKAIATLGYSKWGAERAIDSEVVVKKGTFPEKYFETALDIAIKENQDLFGLSEVLGSGDAAFSHPNSRPGVEIYFKPGTTNKKIMPILKSFQKHGFDGFMFVKEARESSPLGQTITQKGKGEKATFDLGKKDLKENSIGIRLQIVPEIDYRFGKITKEQLATDGFMDKYIGEKIDGLVGLTNKLQGHKLVADANFYSYNTLAIGKENYGKYKSLRSYNKEFNSGLTVEEAVRRFAAGEIRGRQNLPSKDLGPKKTVTQSIKDGVIDYLKNPKMGMSIQDLSTPKHTEKILELEEKVNAGAEMVIFGDQKVSKSKSYNLLKRFFDKVNFIKPIKRLGYVKIDTEQKANAHDAIYQWNGDIAEGKYIIDQNYKTMAKSLTPEQQADLTHVLELRTRTPGSRGPMKKIDIETNKKITELLNDPNAANDPAVSHAANVIRKRLDVIHGMLKKMNPDIGFIEEYIPHMWESTSKQNKSLVNRLGTRIPFEKGRFIPTYAEGIEMGLKPRFKSALDLLKIYENTAIRAVANFNLAQNMRAITNKDGHKMLNTKDKSPDWPTVDHWALGKHTQVDPEIYPFVNAIFSERFGGANASLGQQRFIKGMEGYNAYSKAASLAFSAFHVGALAESGIAMGQHPFAYKRGKKLIDTDPHIVRGALRHGLQIDVTADAQKQRVDKLLNKWANANVPLWKQAGKGVQAYKNWFDTAMWENYHTGHKLAAYHRHYAKELARSLKKKDGRSSEAIGREIAQFVNDAFGGQNWELLLKSQKWQQLGSGIFLAPDWTMSNLLERLEVTGLGLHLIIFYFQI